MCKLLHLRFLLLIGTLAISLSGCLQDECDGTRVFIQLEPIYKTEAEIRQEITTEKPRTLKNPGKIYVYGDYLFVNEYNEGIHIINNKNPKNPINISFINILGNVDMAVRDNMLYADHYIDLITLNISNPAAVTVSDVTENAFPALSFDANRGYVVAYKEVEVHQDAPCDWQDGWFERGGGFFVDQAFLSSFYNSKGVNSRGSAVSGNGTGGSMARFTLYEHYLYTVDNISLRVFDVKDAAAPYLANTVNIGRDIETIYPYKTNLFIGSRAGMFIYDNTNPLFPTQLSVFQHARACDPVFVEGDLAYVTLHAGTPCEGTQNQLDIIDVSNLRNPKLLKTHQMHRPMGLSVVDGTVYLCEDDEGLKVFDAKDWNELDLLSHLKHLTTYDIITLPTDNRAIVVGKDGLYQFDISNPAKLKELSRIPVGK